MNKNNIISGLLLGSVLPLVAWVIFGYMFKNELIMNKPGIPYLIAVALNLIIMRICFTKGYEKTAQGIMFITFVFMLVTFLLKLKP